MKISYLMLMLMVFGIIASGGCNDSTNWNTQPGNQTDWGNNQNQPVSTPPAGNINANIPAVQTLQLENYQGGFFSIQKPAGWDIITAGTCTLFGFYMRDRQDTLNQVFYFGSVGPVYMNPQQKNIDLNYMRTGGYNVAWTEMPVVYPLTPANFLLQWHAIVSTRIARNYMQPLPMLRNLQAVSAQTVSSFMNGRGQTALVRAVFEKDGRIGQGLFMVTVVPSTPFTGGPGGGTAYGLMVMGITAEKNNFPALQKSLLSSLQSFFMTDQYVMQCMQTQQQQYKEIMKAGQTLRESSDIIIKGWENRNKTYDIIAEKRSDAILGKERLYDPDTGEVYEFTNGFYQNYNLNRNAFNKSNLQQLPPDSYKLWTSPTLNGNNYVMREH